MIEKAILKSLSFKFSITIESFNKEKIKDITSKKGLSKDHILLIIQIIENCEKAKYSRSSNMIMNNDLNSTRKIVDLILSHNK